MVQSHSLLYLNERLELKQAENIDSFSFKIDEKYIIASFLINGKRVISSYFTHQEILFMYDVFSTDFITKDMFRSPGNIFFPPFIYSYYYLNDYFDTPPPPQPKQSYVELILKKSGTLHTLETSIQLYEKYVSNGYMPPTFQTISVSGGHKIFLVTSKNILLFKYNNAYLKNSEGLTDFYLNEGHNKIELIVP